MTRLLLALVALLIVACPAWAFQRHLLRTLTTTSTSTSLGLFNFGGKKKTPASAPASSDAAPAPGSPLAKQLEAMARFKAKEAAKNAPPPPAPKAAPKSPFGGFSFGIGGGGSKPTVGASAGGAKAAAGKTTTLSKNAVAAIQSRGGSAKNIASIDVGLTGYVNGGVSPDVLYKTVVLAVGSKDAAYSVFPDLIGSLPRGPQKIALNAWYQSVAN